MKAPLGNLYSPRGATSIYRFDFSGAGGGRNVLRLCWGGSWVFFGLGGVGGGEGVFWGLGGWSVGFFGLN